MKTQNKEKSRLQKRIGEAIRRLDLPYELFGRELFLSLEGDRQLLAERHGGILEYGTERIRIAANPADLEITGTDLTLTAMSADSLRICGHILGISFLKQV